VRFVRGSMESITMFEFPSIKSGAAYINKRTFIENFDIALAVVVCCVAVVCWVPEKRACEITPRRAEGIIL